MFQIIAFAYLVIFYGFYITKMILQKKAGIKTDQMGKGKEGFTKILEIVMKVATHLTVLVEVVSIVLGTSRLSEPFRLVGAFLGALGVLLFVMAILTMKDSWRAGVTLDSTELVTKGIFKISRNPAFLGFDLLYLGVVLMFFNVVLFCISALSVILLHLQIVNNEEPAMLDAFGEEYLLYRKTTCRYFGKISWKKPLLPRLCYLVIVVLLCVIALLVRSWYKESPNFFNTYFPDTAWTMAVYCGFGMVFNKGWKWNLPLSLGFSYLIEISQLFSPPFLVAIRQTTLGGLIFGFGFLWSDIICYTVGALLCFLVQFSVRKIFKK